MGFETLLDRGERTSKPRATGITVILDKGLGVRAVEDLGEVAGDYCDFAKIAWGSALITGQLEAKFAAYRKFDIEPLLGGTLFEYCYLRDRVEQLLELCKAHKLHVEISDGVIDLARDDKLGWIEKFAKHGHVLSEVGGKTASHDLDWESAVKEELSAGASQVVIEGRELGPVGKEIRTELVDALLDAIAPSKLVFEALERYQQVWLIKRVGPNVNLGNILPKDLLTLESFRLGLKEHTLLHFAPSQPGS
jgi:phosphosulfolactate synthase